MADLRVMSVISLRIFAQWQIEGGPMLGSFGAIAMGLAVVLGSATFIVPAGLALIGCPHANMGCREWYSRIPSCGTVNPLGMTASHAPA